MIIIRTRDAALEEKLLAFLAREHVRAEEFSLSTRAHLSFPDLDIDARARQVLQGGQPVALTKTEFDLLLFLASHAGTALSREELFQAVWGRESEDGIKVVANTISNIRGKMKRRGESGGHIQTVRGGYVFRS